MWQDRHCRFNVNKTDKNACSPKSNILVKRQTIESVNSIYSNF